jgi:hypothetical protein
MAQAAPRLLQLGFMVAMAIGALPAWATACILPDAKEYGSLDPAPEPSWTPQEKWVWKQTLAGEVADLTSSTVSRSRSTLWQGKRSGLVRPSPADRGR